MGPPILAAHAITKRFGAFTALDSVDFDVRRGEIDALLGENGAGKSTLMYLLSGLLRPTTGEILLDGAPVRFASPSDAERRGIGMVHQHFLLVPPLSVRENLLLGASSEMGGALSYPLARVVEEAQTIADRLGWRIPWDAPVGSLPVGTQQRIEILKALRGEARVLIFDEPTAVLTPTETPELFATIRQLAAEGRGIVFISHKLNEVLELARRITVLRRGRVVLRTTADAIDTTGLAEAMVGTDSEAAEMLKAQAALTVPSALTPNPSPNARRGVTIPVVFPTGDTPAPVETPATGPPLPALGEGLGVRAPLLSVQNLTVNGPPGAPRPLLSGITFDVAPGEVFGIAGVDGNGQAELADCLAGLLRPSDGSIQVSGGAPAANPATFRHAGVMVIPADRQRRGLALPLSVTENLALGVYDKGEFRRGPLLLWPRLRERANGLIRRFDIRATGPDVPVRALSGGNQQKVVVARALADAPRVVVAANPTRGLDVGAIAYVHDSLRRVQAAGAAVILISTELEEVLSLSDRVAVLYEGRFSGIVPPNTPREEIGLLMGGQAHRGDSA
jgi:simple sugar transport system ATP-binding protein